MAKTKVCLFNIINLLLISCYSFCCFINHKKMIIRFLMYIFITVI